MEDVVILFLKSMSGQWASYLDLHEIIMMMIFELLCKDREKQHTAVALLDLIAEWL